MRTERRLRTERRSGSHITEYPERAAPPSFPGEFHSTPRITGASPRSGVVSAHRAGQPTRGGHPRPGAGGGGAVRGSAGLHLRGTRARRCEHVENYDPTDRTSARRQLSDHTIGRAAITAAKMTPMASNRSGLFRLMPVNPTNKPHTIAQPRYRKTQPKTDNGASIVDCIPRNVGAHVPDILRVTVRPAARSGHREVSKSFKRFPSGLSG
jgi:hypothetical protein